MNTKVTSTGLRFALERLYSSTTADSLEGRTQGARYCLDDCAEYIHRDNRERGWWNDLETGEPLKRNVGELLMLMVSELAEIPEGAGAIVEMDDKLEHRLMFEVELADCAIRIFDTAGALAPDFASGFLYAASNTFGPLNNGFLIVEQDRHLMGIVRLIAQAMEHHRKNKQFRDSPGFDIYLGMALHSVFHLANRNSLAVPAAICEKLEFNARRADHKPENRREAGGKAY